MTKELKELKAAIEAKRFDGRIEEIRKAFKAYKESFGLSRWQRFKLWFKGFEMKRICLCMTAWRLNGLRRY